MEDVHASASENNNHVKAQKGSRLSRYLKASIPADTHIIEFELLLLSFATGMQDAIAYPDFACFASNQTGNTIILAIGALDISSPHSSSHVDLINAVISLSCFAAGILTLGQLANWFGIRHLRWWLLASNLWQTVLMAVAAILAHAADNDTKPRFRKAALAILALSSGSQVGMVRALKITDITTAMVTAAYIDIFIDPSLFAGVTRNRQRNRRVGFLNMWDPRRLWGSVLV
ncbi:uncharacterized protein M437DRAFT_66497 [Aureobasidium melanogenum CBS 110374]|uniref:DUF1275 domain protein n=1 Tax=Aureobasidium melanogenum (strain CBS 110374) TaxID=1043003 RepID=A0A074VY90_AURM1|nr:uncharacterized protein M437DRAFT_66497 [Aureobasidium melanogenum CBS 110374]KEQ62642.1 hypothetical protein M437DRAFT_66497 [Aureobasidium melanogenum CBS 110374]